MSTSLYRMYGVDGQLLYIGISTDVGKRIKQHAKGKDWWTDVASITVEHHRSRTHAEVAERNAIVTEKPLWNIVYNLPTAKPVAAAFIGLLEALDEMRDELAARTEPSDEPPTVLQLNSRPCEHCGAGILGRPSAVRVSGRLAIVHAECRRQVLDDEARAEREDRYAALAERRSAIMRGDIA